MTKAAKTLVCHRRYLPYISTHNSHFVLLFATTIFVARASSSPIPQPHVSSHNGPSTSALYDKSKTFNVRVAAATCAAVSMTASFLAFYWFCRMEKRFRHRLIMLLIYGDLMRATWLFLFAVVSMSRGTIYTRSSFCQASGFLIQYGTETSDYSVLVMAIHSAIQVFRPSTTTRNDGLYPFRGYVYAGAVFVPTIMAALAFINPHWGYMSQGAFCSLPLRPFWYRLALTWIPRYLIAIIILGLAVAIYAHVGFEFRAFSKTGQNFKPSVSTTTPIVSARDGEEGDIGDTHETPETQMYPPDRRTSSVVHDTVAPRQASTGPSLVETITSLSDSIELGGRSQSLLAGSRRGSECRPAGPQRSDTHLSIAPTRSSITKSKDCLSQQPDVDACQPHSGDTSPLSECPTSHAQRHMMQERIRIHRQLRLVFIYPLVYILMWLIPFIYHCMTYKDYWAAHPLYWLSLLATICVTSMGAVDCLIFTLRERPWRHIPSSDGSFFGSFVVWRRMSRSSQRTESRHPTNALQRACTETNPLSLPRVRQSVRTSRSSDQQKAEAERARVRLEYEKEDRRKGNAGKGARLLAQHDARLEAIESPGETLEQETKMLKVEGSEEI